MNINRLMANMDNMARTNDFSVNIFGPGGTQFAMMNTDSINDFASEGLANPLSSDESLASPFSTAFSKFIGGRDSETGITNKWRMPNQQISIRGIRCTNISLPGRSFVTTPHTEYAGGPKVNRIQSIDYEGGQVQMTFMCDSTFEDKNKIELWQRMIFDGAYTYEYYDNYVGHIEIEQEGRNKQPIYSVRLHEVFPSSIQAQTLDAMGGPNLQTFTCTFAFRTWSSNFNNQSGGILGGLFNKISGKINTKIDKKLDDILGF